MSAEGDSARHSPTARPGAPHVTRSDRISEESIDARWKLIRESGRTVEPVEPVEQARPLQPLHEALLDAQTIAHMERFEHNVENFIGTVKVPVGLAGPLRVNGKFARGDYYVPLATSEAALVASYSRGAQLVTDAGGCSAILIDEGVSRAPGFAFANLKEASRFAGWIGEQLVTLRKVAESTTRYGKLKTLHSVIEGNNVYLRFEYTTGDASGQNMATIATEAACRHIADRSPVRPKYWFIEANLSSDKKASIQSLLSVRGKRVSADVVIPAQMVAQRLHTTSQRMVDYWTMSATGAALSGTIGVQGHYANCIAALYIACGQDAACVAESAVGVSRLALDGDDLYATVTLPNIMVGTVGGGTSLPSQRACLEILGLYGPGRAHALAELCAALCLAGELSISGAICAGEFTAAHQRLARAPEPKGSD